MMGGSAGSERHDAPPAAPSAEPTSTARTAFHLAGLAALLLFLVIPRWADSPQFTDTDAAVHAMTGVFFLDLLADRPSPSALVRYAEEYYAHYPALGLVIYPPLVPLSLAPAYALMGISASSARLVILLYAIFFAWALYFWIRRHAGPPAGIAAAILGAMNPQSVAWASEVMLEIPACAFMTIAMATWSAWLDARAAARGRGEPGSQPTLALLAAASLLAAIHAKQTAGFLLLPMAVELVRREGWAGLRAREVWGAAALTVLLLLPLGFLTRRYGAYGTVQLDPATYGLDPWTAGYWLHWIRHLPEALHPSLLFAAGAACLLPRARARTAVLAPALLCLAAWYLAFSWIPIRTYRFALFAVPWFAGIGGLLLAPPLGRSGPAALAASLPGRAGGMALALWALHAATLSPAPKLHGLDEAAAHAARHAGGRPVLYDDHQSANFIFALRRLLPRDHPAMVLRGSKTLTVTASGALRSYPRITTPDSFAAFLDRSGVEWIYVEDWPGDAVALPHARWLRDALTADTERYRLEERFPIRGSAPPFEATAILVYRYLAAPPPPESGILELEVPSAGTTIRVPLRPLTPAPPRPPTP